ncbi:hypothetical protein DH2020_003919 [Rehmannia glutinosa]|uniref:NPH3 domain-containing protein n=1 Tax=Rehmannia glutinosa TaxID=99300 RepID=A0ABR0XN36_REHGL
MRQVRYDMTINLNAYNIFDAFVPSILKCMRRSRKATSSTRLMFSSTLAFLKVWKDSIILFPTMKTLLPLSEESKLINRCIDAIASMASIDVSKVDWSYTFKAMVVKPIDGYLAEIAKDHNLSLSMFMTTAEMVSKFSRPSHDGLYRAIDTYLKAHPSISKSERKKICRLMDCKKLSADACMHAVQNERLPLRVVVQVLFFEQIRVSASSGTNTPDLPKAIKDLNCDSALRGEIATLRLGNGRNVGENRVAVKAAKTKCFINSKKLFSKIWSRKEGTQTENSGSDSSDSLGSANHDDVKCTPTRKGRHSVS